MAAPDAPAITVAARTKYSVTLDGTPFSDPDGDAHDASQWQIRRIGGVFGNFYDTGWIADLEQHQTGDILTPGKWYEARVRYRDAAGEVSNWSNVTSFNGRVGKILAGWIKDETMVRSFKLDPDHEGNDTAFEDRCYAYDQATAILAFLQIGNVDEAYQMAVAAIDGQIAQSDPDLPGAVPFSWDHRSAVPADPYVRSGAMAWMVYAWARCLKADPTHSSASTVQTAMENGLRYLEDNERYRKADGGIGLVSGGQGRYLVDQTPTQWDPDYDPSWCSIEHNIDCWFMYWAAYQVTGDEEWKTAADEVQEGMLTYAWNPDWGSFWRGVDQNGNDDGHGALDANTWGAMLVWAFFMPDRAHSAMDHADEVYRIIDNISGEDNEGYKPYSQQEGYPNAVDEIWLEGSFGATVGKFKIGERADAAQLVAEWWENHQQPDGSFRYTLLKPGPDDDSPNSGLIDQRAVASTTWALFNQDPETALWNERRTFGEADLREGFLLGGPGNLLDYGLGETDDGTPVSAEIIPNEIAAAGVKGEAVYRNLYLTFNPQTQGTVTITPIVDGRELTAAAHTFTVPIGGTPASFEISLMEPHTRAGSTVLTHGIRGVWFTVKIEMEDDLGGQGKLMIENAEVEVRRASETHPRLPFIERTATLFSRPDILPFFFGHADDGKLGRALQGRDDLGQPVQALARPNRVAPAGTSGECEFRNLWLAFTRANQADVDLEIRPLVDQMSPQDTIEPLIKTLTLPAVTDPVTDVHEVPLLAGHDDSAGTEVLRRALRGSWFTFQLTNPDPLPTGDIIVESAEVDYKVIAESEQAVSSA